MGSLATEIRSGALLAVQPWFPAREPPAGICRKVARFIVRPAPMAVVIVVIAFSERMLIESNGHERGVVHFDLAAVKVCDVKVLLAVQHADGDALVDGILFRIVDDDNTGAGA